MVSARVECEAPQSTLTSYALRLTPYALCLTLYLSRYAVLAHDIVNVLSFLAAAGGDHCVLSVPNRQNLRPRIFPKPTFIRPLLQRLFQFLPTLVYQGKGRTRLHLYYYAIKLFLTHTRFHVYV